ncbi:MAG: hypothetical protein WA666_09905 [Nitrospirota bacterium]
MPPGEECPPLEDLAALAEKKVSKNDRSRLLAHVASCARCSEIYLMACGLGPEVTTSKRPDYSWQKRRLIPLAAAAGLLLVIISVPLLLTRNSKKGLSETVAPYTGAPARVERPVPAVMPGKSKHRAKPRVIKEEREEQPTQQAQAIPPPEPAETTCGKTEIPPASPRPVAGSAPPEAAGRAPVEKFEPMPKAQMMEAQPLQKKAMKMAEAPRAAARPLRVPVGDEAAEEPRYICQKRIGIDRYQRFKLLSVDSVLSDKEKIEGLYKDLRLDSREFPLQDITKIVVHRSKQSRTDAKSETSVPNTLQADISLGEGGLLTIVVLEENQEMDTPRMKFKDRPIKIPVGC